MAVIDLDLLRRQAVEASEQGNPLPTDPLVILHLLDTITTLMDDDSILAHGQRIAKQALDKMVEARKERDEERTKREALEADFSYLRSLSPVPDPKESQMTTPRPYKPGDPLSGPLQEGELEVLQDDFYDMPIARVSVFQTLHFNNDPVVAVSLFDHVAVNERDGRRSIYFQESDLVMFLEALRKHKTKG